MTYQALQFISKVLDDFLERQFGLNESKVLINRIINSDGSIPEFNQNKIIITLINIEEDWDRRNFPADSKHQISKLSYSIYFLLSSNFDDYSESLKFLDAPYNFLIELAKFTAASYPDFPAELNSFDLERPKTLIGETSNLMISNGAKYQPSVLFKIRLRSAETVI